MVKVFLDAKTAEKVVLLSGPAKRDSPCPVELDEHIELSELVSWTRPLTCCPRRAAQMSYQSRAARPCRI